MNSRLCALLLGFSLAGAQAATMCQFTSGGALDFGTYNVLSAAPNDSLLNVVVTCNRDGGPANVSVTLGIGPGAHGSGVGLRRMRGTGPIPSLLDYGLYRDSGRSAVWGFSNGIDVMTQTVTVPNKGSASIVFTVYGRIAPQQDVAVGPYGDSVQLTLTP